MNSRARHMRMELAVAGTFERDRLDRSAGFCSMRRLTVLCSVLLTACATPLPGPMPAPTPGEPSPGTPTPRPDVELPSLGFFSRIRAPDGHDPVLQLTGKGVQVFRCEPRKGGGFAWAFRLPEADLFNGPGKATGRHGANFTFEHADGSRLLGAVAAFDEAPRNGDLRWLLMTTRSFGTGAFGGVTHVQRVNTSGGMPPSSCQPAQQNQLLRVGFSADFVFYKPR